MRIGLPLILILLCVPPAAAAQDSDLDFIPKTIPDDPAGTTPHGHNVYLENVIVADALRQTIVPLPPPPPPVWEERLFLDMRRQWVFDPTFSITLSDRFNFRAENDIVPPSHETIRNDFREGYASWEFASSTYLDVGRINVKTGVAAGFNPTDFFKTRAVVEPLSADPSALREDRLGTVMTLIQHDWNAGAATVAFAPGFRSPTPIYTATSLPSFNPMFDRTNAQDRWLAKGSMDLGSDFSPEVVYYREGDRSHYGANLTHGVGQSTVVYAEWAGGERASLIADAMAYGRNTGTIPSTAPNALAFDPNRHFKNDLAVGLSYATSTKITFNVEYDYHQAGFSQGDWDQWFQAGAARVAVSAELWFIRDYAAEQQEPAGEHSLFLRADWMDAMVRNLEITGFINTDVHDGSSLAQVTASYYVSRAWTVEAVAAATLGSKNSNFGSLPTAATFLLKMARYF